MPDVPRFGWPVKLSTLYTLRSPPRSPLPLSLMASKKACSCKDCKSFRYLDENGHEQMGRLLDPKMLTCHAQREKHAAIHQPGTTLLLATISDDPRPRFAESMAVRPRDHQDDAAAPSQHSRAGSNAVSYNRVYSM